MGKKPFPDIHPIKQEASKKFSWQGKIKMKAEINIAMRAEARGRGESKDIIKDARRNKIKDTRRGDDRNETRE